MRFINAYGPTECTCCSHSHSLGSKLEHGEVVPIGAPVDSYTCYLLDQNERIVPPHAMGEIYIGGPGLMSGYYKQPDLTSKVLRRHENIPDKPLLYKTGDLGYWDQNGEVVFVGRGDFQVKIRGQRLELGEIEAVVSSVDGISSSLAVKKTDVEKGDFLVVYVVPLSTDRTDQLSTEVKSVCLKLLPNHMVPQHVVLLDKWPLLSTGKVDRAKLPDPDLQLVSDKMISPRNSIETILLEIYCEILKTDSLSVETSWQDAGGNSLFVMILMSRLRLNETLSSVPWKVSWIFQFPTIALLAAHVREWLAPGKEFTTQTDSEPDKFISVELAGSSILELSTGTSFSRVPSILAPRRRRYRMLFFHGGPSDANVTQRILSGQGWMDSFESASIDWFLPDGSIACQGMLKDDAERYGVKAALDLAGYAYDATYFRWGGIVKKDILYFSSENHEEDWLLTVSHVKRIIDIYGPFDMIGGMSMGAGLANTLMHCQAAFDRGDATIGIDFGLRDVKLMLLMSPHISMVHDSWGLFDPSNPLYTPTLVLTGTNEDEYFSLDFAQIRACLANELRYDHDGGHNIPPVTEDLRCFVDDILTDISNGRYSRTRHHASD